MSGKEKSAEELKQLGNEAFAAKDFTSAIEHYTNAIKVDPSNHVFFSNRSASYAGLKDWTKAIDDAKECIRLDPQFMKGYYRLATAQLELEEYGPAEATIKQGLTLDANNSQLLKVLRSIKQAKKAATSVPASAKAGQGRKSFDPASSKELYDLQTLNAQTTREYQTVQANLTKAQREQRVSQITLGDLEVAGAEAKGYYRSIGKIFVKSTKDKVVDHLRTKMQEQAKKESDCTQKMEYLERRMKSQQQNMEELMSGGD